MAHNRKLLGIIILLTCSFCVSAQRAHLVAQVGHENEVRDLAFSPDGRLMLSASHDSAVLWEVATGREIRRFLGMTTQLEPFSADARYVMTAYEEYTGYGRRFSSGWFTRTTEHLFDARTGLEVRFRAADSPGYWAVAISPDNRLVATGDLQSNIVRLWDVASGRQLRQVPAFTKDVTGGIGFTKDGRFLLTVISAEKNARVVLWDTSTGKEVRRFPGQLVRESRDSRFLVTVTDRTGHLWDRETGREVRSFGPYFSSDIQVSSADWDASFSFDGNLVAIRPAGEYNKESAVHVHETATGKELRTFTGDHPAFSPDGKFLMTLTSTKYPDDGQFDTDTAHLWEVRTGLEFRHFPAEAAAFSADGRFLVALNNRNPYRKIRIAAGLWDIATGEKVLGFPDQEVVRIARFSPDGRFMATVGGDAKSIHLWDIAARRDIQGFAGQFRAGAFQISPDERWLVTKTTHSVETKSPEGDTTYENQSVAQLWDLNIGQVVRRFEFKGASVSFSSDSRLLAIEDGDLSLREVATWQELRRIKGANPILSSDGLIIATSDDANMYISDVSTGREIWRFAPRKTDGADGLSGERFIAISPDGRYGLTTASDVYLPARLWDLKTGRALFTTDEIETPPGAVAFSPDGRWFVVTTQTFGDGGGGGDVCMHSLPTGRLVQCYEGLENAITDVGFTRDSRVLLASSAGNLTVAWDRVSGRVLRRFVGSSFKLSPNGQQLLTSDQNRARVWNFYNGAELPGLEHSTGVGTIGFMRNGGVALTSSSDAALALWDRRSGKELCRLVASASGDWVVIAPDGRFDANNLDEIEGLHWVTPEAPFTTLPLEIFMRDYYEPQLLARLIKCTNDPEHPCEREFKPVRDLSKLNQIQPRTRIAGVSLPDEDYYVNVTVEVGKGDGRPAANGQAAALSTGVYDLRLFRDGQMVASWPVDGAAKLQQRTTTDFETNEKLTGEQRLLKELQDWRQTTEIKAGTSVNLDQTGMMTLPPFRVKLPRGKDASEIVFSAYVFNEDRVKSSTARWQWSDELKGKLPKARSVKGRAYIITVGVNAYENADWNLKYAANDARQIQRTLVERLSQGGDYQEVVPVSLISDYQTKDGQDVVTEKSATKANVKAILDLLAGEQIDSEVLKRIPNAGKLRPAEPDDLVIISFSSHGYADNQGNFYLIPYDVGRGSKREITSDLLRHCISSEELSLWLRDVDAGEMVMIVDACHSAASVHGEGFKPGPMGSRGLGQLSYDKGIRILTSTQSDDVALETDFTQQGLLSYALTRDGIEAGEADFKPPDKVIKLSEWLEYGVDRVPRLYAEIRTRYQALALNELKSIGVGPGGRTKLLIFSRDGSNSSMRKGSNQLPSLFDFTRKKREVILSRLSAP